MVGSHDSDAVVVLQQRIAAEALVASYKKPEDLIAFVAEEHSLVEKSGSTILVRKTSPWILEIELTGWRSYLMSGTLAGTFPAKLLT
jgi:hypothetical protein